MRAPGVAFLSTLIWFSTGICETDQGGGKLVFLIDQSGSMDQSDRANLRGDAANLILDLSEDEQEAAVGFFSQYLPTELELEPRPLSSSTRQMFARKLYSARRGSSTYLNQALSVTASFVGRQRVGMGQSNIILLTDGNDTSNSKSRAFSGQKAISDSVAAGARVTTVALGAGADSAFLSEVAFKTGGKAYATQSPSDLLMLYQWYVVETLRRAHQTGPTLDLPFPVRSATVVVLKEPHENRVIQGLQSGESSMTRESPGVYSSSAGRHYEVLRFAKLPAGKWQAITTGRSANVSWIVDFPVSIEISSPAGAEVAAGLPCPVRVLLRAKDPGFETDFRRILPKFKVGVEIINRGTGRVVTGDLTSMPGGAEFEFILPDAPEGYLEIKAHADFDMRSGSSPLRIIATKTIRAVASDIRLRFDSASFRLDTPLQSVATPVRAELSALIKGRTGVIPDNAFRFTLTRDGETKPALDRLVSLQALHLLNIDPGAKLVPGRYAMKVEAVGVRVLCEPAQAMLSVGEWPAMSSVPVLLFSSHGEPRLDQSVILKYGVAKQDGMALNSGDLVEGVWRFESLLGDSIRVSHPLVPSKVLGIERHGTDNWSGGQASYLLKYPGEYAFAVEASAQISNQRTNEKKPPQRLSPSPATIFVSVPEAVHLDQNYIGLTLRADDTELEFAVTGNSRLGVNRDFTLVANGPAVKNGTELSLPSDWLSADTTSVPAVEVDGGSKPFSIGARFRPVLEIVDVSPGIYTTDLALVDKRTGVAFASASLKILVEPRRPNAGMFAVTSNLPREVEAIEGGFGVFEGKVSTGQQDAVDIAYQIVVYSRPDQKEVTVGDIVLKGLYRIKSIAFMPITESSVRKVTELRDGSKAVFQFISFSGTEEVLAKLGVTQIEFEPLQHDDLPTVLRLGVSEEFKLRPIQ